MTVRRALGAAVAATLVLLTGCGDRQARPAAAPTPTPPASAWQTDSVKPAQLKGLLVRLGDLPPGARPDSVGEEDTSEDCMTATLAGAGIAAGKDFPAGPTAEAAFQLNPKQGAYHDVALVREPAARKAMDGYRAVVRACRSFETDFDGTKMTVRLTPRPVAKIGDEAVAFRLTLATPGGTLTADATVWRYGGVMSLIGTAGVGASDPALEAKLIRLVDQRARAVLGPAKRR